MAGIYIHVPFCSKKCNYCNFFSLATRQFHQEFTDSLLIEIQHAPVFFKDLEIHTVYFGGGTPSLLETDLILKILDAIRSTFKVSKEAEITLEANPDDMTLEKTSIWRKLGINRLSIGIQSFHDDDLQFLSRSHHAKSAMTSIETARSAGFDNLSIDLIYGIPGQTSEKLAYNVSQAVAYGIQHISAYALTVEPKTALEAAIRKKKLPNVDEELALAHFGKIREMLIGKGYTHYEISNYCIEPFFSQHNTSYWNGVPYLGLGPSAHSFDGKTRFWNVSALGTYINNLQNGLKYNESELLTKIDKFNEYLMTGLRTMWGCSSNTILEKFGEEYQQYFLNLAQPLIGSKICCESNVYTISPNALFLSDGIISDLMMTNEKD